MKTIGAEQSLMSTAEDDRAETFSPSATMIIEYNDGQKDGIILVDRLNWPYGWCMPGGMQDFPRHTRDTLAKVKEKIGNGSFALDTHGKKYLNLLEQSAVDGESLEQCAVREAYEETNLWLTLYNPEKPLVHSDPNRDPRKFKGFGFVPDHLYVGLGMGELRAGDDAKAKRLVSMSELEQQIKEGMPFDHGASAQWYLERRRSLEKQLKDYASGNIPNTMPRYSFFSDFELQVYKNRLGISQDIKLERAV